MGYSRGTGIGQACHTVPQASEARSLPAWQSSHPIDLDERGFICMIGPVADLASERLTWGSQHCQWLEDTD